MLSEERRLKKRDKSEQCEKITSHTRLVAVTMDIPTEIVFVFILY